jgi:hypothetical protein
MAREMAVWIMSLTQPPLELSDLPTAVRTLQELLDAEKQQGLSVRPERVTDQIGAVYKVRGEAGIERYWLSTDPPPE